MKFTLHGNPIAKQRHRHNGKFSYDPQEKQKKAVKSDLMAQLARMSNSENKTNLGLLKSVCEASAFDVHMKFYFPPNESDSIATKNLKLWGITAHSAKPDCDNLQKFYCDAMNEIVFQDDSMITFISGEKLYSNEPRTEIEIMPKKTLPLTCDTEKFLSVFSPHDLKELLFDIKKIALAFECDLDVHDLPENEKYLWLKDISDEMIQFADKYCDKLKKIKCKKVAGEGKVIC